MRKYLLVSLVFILAVMISMPAYAQSAKEAVLGLKKLEARCQAGTLYRDYSNAVAEAKFPVNLFMESADAKKNPELADLMNKVMKHYEFAGTIWNHKMVGGSQGILIFDDSPLFTKISILYPQVKPEPGSGRFRCYMVDKVLSDIWANASKELENATKLYAKTEGETSSDIDKLKKENERLKAAAENEKLRLENEQLKAIAENERLKADNERFKAENENLKKQIELMTPKRKK